ncbi:hypothetical protein F4604DRAFT_1940859 [Suillus subluteus]|nr:hypothetical protein F4604DRAFT_1940859 [Suillus subluteus]
MAHPVIHKAKLEAARERHCHHYANSKTKESKAANKFTKELLNTVTKALHCRDEDESKSESDLDDDSESDDDESNKLYDLPECLHVLKAIKDEMLETISDDSCKFIEGVLCNYVKSFPEDSSPGDISIIETSIAKVQEILNWTIHAQDQILNFCGVSPEWHAANSVTRFLRTVLAYLEDIQCLLFSGGVCELTVAHSMGEMMYQKGIKI